jgi:hypothetical protein
MNKADEIAIHFPKIYPKALEKKKEIAKIKGTFFYKEALKKLFEIDFLSKTINVDSDIFLDIFKSQLLCL